MIQSYDIQIPAGGTQLLEVGAQIFDFLSSGSAFDTIQVLPEFQQGNVTLKLGQGFDAGKVVNRWFVKNPGTTAINGTVVLSTAGFRNFRISGDVNVLDGGKSRTLSGVSFLAYGNSTGVASQYGRVQLWNPVGNTNRLIVSGGTLLANAVAQVATLDFMTAPLANVGENGVSKKSGSATSTAYLTWDTTLTASALPVMKALSCQANLSQDFKLSEPIVVLPGAGLVMYSSFQNAFIGAGFEWYEEPNT
ncbi:hypothetical protein [Burkholderia vietnamiensis]|uniref:hypothetical protein n=1 Tax=Burkholderia vietnamiensis TaxID=60552 RepID=UPI00158D7750|nr:hypothetical protein [Burkholderia vietnamiensis]